MPRKSKHIKVLYVKLGRQKVWGYADHKMTVEIDPRLTGKKHLEILLHEGTHCLQQELSEEAVERISIALTNMLWKEGYRKVDLLNNVKLQDGKIHE